MVPPATRRMYRRIPTDYPACFLVNASFRQAVVRDLSLNGFRVEGLTEMKRNTIVMLRLWLPEVATSLDVDQAVVRWVNDREFGVQIIALTNEADLRLALHVERVLAHQAGMATAPCLGMATINGDDAHSQGRVYAARKRAEA